MLPLEKREGSSLFLRCGQLRKTSERVRMSGGRFIAQTFMGYGVSHVFFVEAILRLALVEMEALGIKRILTHSEKTAAYMADGYARACHKPGICMSQSIGAANLASGLKDAYLSLSPVIALTGQRIPLERYRNAYQETLHGPMFDTVTKYSVSVDTIEQLPYLLRQAFREATSGAPRPVHLDVAGHLGEVLARAEAELDVLVEVPFTHYPSFRPEPELNSLKEAMKMLRMAEKPVIVAGGGAIASQAGPEIIQLAEKLSIPIATSLNAKGIVVEDHPLNVGVVGTYSRPCANQVVSEADIVLFIGSRTGDMVTHGWKVPSLTTPVIQIDINPCELGRNYPNCVSIMGDAKRSVSRMIEMTQEHVSHKPWSKKAHDYVVKWRSEVEPLRASKARPIRPERLCKEITDILPSNAVLVADTGYASIWTGTMVYLRSSEQMYLKCAGSLGWAFPASIGVKCAAPDRPVICFTGDGGFWYHIAELETACRYGIRTVTVVNNNSCLRQCLEGINAAYGNRPGDKDELYRFKEVNFARIAEEIGCIGIRVEDPERIKEALRRGLDADRPALIEVITDPRCRAPLPT